MRKKFSYFLSVNQKKTCTIFFHICTKKRKTSIFLKLITMSLPGLADGHDELLDGLLGEVELDGLVEDEEDEDAE